MKPKISIIIPTRNEEEFIAKCLDSILHNDFLNYLVEIFIVDGMSEDNTRNIVKRYVNKYIYIYLLDNGSRSTPFALNIGLAKAEGDYFMILGAHSELADNYLAECLAVFATNDTIGCVGGVMKSEFKNNSSRIISCAMSSPFGVGNAYFRTGEKEGFVDTVAFGMYKSEVKEKVGLFDEELTRNQDDEYNFRLKKNKYKIYLSQKVNSKYYVRASFRNLYRQYFQYGYWKVFVGRKHKALTSFRQLIPFFWVCFLLLGGISLFFTKKYNMFFSYVLYIYVILALFFAFRKSDSPLDVIRICYAFAVIHFSYGLGYLIGCVDFIVLNKQKIEKHTEISR